MFLFLSFKWTIKIKFDRIYISKGVIGIKSVSIKDLDIKINSGELVSIIGPNGSGKTHILKKMCGKYNNDDIFINDKSISTYSLEYKRNNIASVFDDNIYNTKTPKDELSFYLKKLSFNSDNINNRINDFKNYFKLNNILNDEFSYMSIENRIYIKILSLLIINPSIFCIDDLLTYLNKDKKIKILNYIKEKNITLLSVTSNMEELRLFDKILIINKGKKEVFDKTKEVLKNQELFKELGLALPFINDLNDLLKSYELINEEHLIEKELVDLLWK